jgi:hypothetical protein
MYVDDGRFEDVNHQLPINYVLMLSIHCRYQKRYNDRFASEVESGASFMC